MIEVISSDNPKNSRGRGKKPNKHVGRKSRNAEQTFTVQQDFTAASRVPQGRHRRTRSVVEPDSVQVAPVYQKAPIPTFVTEEETDTLRIDNLQRPFSLNALMELLTSHGGPLEEPHTVEVDGQEVVRDPVWLDAIKTHAYATFRDASHAMKAMESLQGMQWPAASPKHLLIRFSSRSAFDRTDDIQKHEQEEEQRALDFATRTKEVEITAVEKPAESSGGLVVKKRIELASNIRFEVALDSPTKSTLHEAEAKIKDESYSPRSKSKVFYPTAEEQLSRANERAVEYNKSVGSEALLARPIFRQKGFIDGNHECSYSNTQPFWILPANQIAGDSYLLYSLVPIAYVKNVFLQSRSGWMSTLEEHWLRLDCIGKLYLKKWLKSVYLPSAKAVRMMKSSMLNTWRNIVLINIHHLVMGTLGLALVPLIRTRNRDLPSALGAVRFLAPDPPDVSLLSPTPLGLVPLHRLNGPIHKTVQCETITHKMEIGFHRIIQLVKGIHRVLATENLVLL